MSALFGKVCQNGYVVRDIEAAMKFWSEVQRVGPAGGPCPARDLMTPPSAGERSAPVQRYRPPHALRFLPLSNRRMPAAGSRSVSVASVRRAIIM